MDLFGDYLDWLAEGFLSRWTLLAAVLTLWALPFLYVLLLYP